MRAAYISTNSPFAAHGERDRAVLVCVSGHSSSRPRCSRHRPTTSQRPQPQRQIRLGARWLAGSPDDDSSVPGALTLLAARRPGPRLQAQLVAPGAARSPDLRSPFRRENGSRRLKPPAVLRVPLIEQLPALRTSRQTIPRPNNAMCPLVRSLLYPTHADTSAQVVALRRLASLTRG